ncbi:MAG: DUF3179 domain-containing protein, partial [Gammaproteobacteria bacterium]|nr:DUF3179 domain-containing protein [Gammaproteobacteria bacterium]
GTYSVLDKSSIAESKTVPSLTAYERRVDGRTLTFEKSEAGFTDVETGSTWDMFGRATTGELAGESLPPITSAVHFAFAWLAFNPDSAIYE